VLFLDEQQIYVMQYSKVLKNQIITKLKIIYWKVYRDRLKDLGRRGETYDWIIEELLRIYRMQKSR
jgi:hypothetical protein